MGRPVRGLVSADGVGVGEGVVGGGELLGTDDEAEAGVDGEGLGEELEHALSALAATATAATVVTKRGRSREELRKDEPSCLITPRP